jgi:predicted PurR-regulated permease PerM
VTGEGLKLPFYAKATIFFIGAIAFFAILYIARSILIPVVFATIIAIVLSPVVGFFVRFRINRLVAITITLLLTFLVIFAFCSLLISQAVKFSESVPILVDKFTLIINQTITEGSEYFDLDAQKIHLWITKTQSEIISMSTAAIGQSLVIAGSILVVLFLIPVYIFLILFYQPLLLEFIWRLFGKDNQGQVKEIVTQIKTLIQRYLTGLLIEAVIIAILDAGALLILGIQYAVILGIIGALLNIIPYIGGLIAVALPMIVALVTKSTPMYALYVLAAYYFIQLVDNNYIVPIIVSSKVKINALFSIIVVIAGNALWGIPGMFISIPVLAIVKLICDHIESLKPIGFLLGDSMPQLLKMDTLIKKIKGKSK